MWIFALSLLLTSYSTFRLLPVGRSKGWSYLPNYDVIAASLIHSFYEISHIRSKREVRMEAHELPSYLASLDFARDKLHKGKIGRF